MKQFFTIGLLFSLCACNAQNVSGISNKLDSFFTSQNKEGNLYGNVLIASNDTILYKNSFGIADYSSGRKLTDSSVFELASVSKQFTAMGIVLLKEKGKLKYEDSLRHFFPELPYENITVKHLLHHISGLPDYMGLVVENTKEGAIATNADVIALLARHKPAIAFKPGEKWEYSNTGYVLLASIIEKVSGQFFGDYLKENIFQPLGMKHSQVYRRRYEKRTVANYAYGYGKDSTQKWVLPDSSAEAGPLVYKLDGIVGDGIVNSTTTDLLKWSLALDKNTLMSKEVQNEIFTSGSLDNGEKTQYGYGWAIIDNKIAGRVVQHSGGWPGYHTFISKHIDNGKTIIVLSNHDRMKLPFAKLTNLLYGVKEEEKIEVKIDEAILKQYEGEYELAPGFVITVTTESGKIYAQATGQDRFEMFPEKEDLFFLKVVEAKLQFERNDKKQVTGLVLFQNGQEVPGKKIK